MVALAIAAIVASLASSISIILFLIRIHRQLQRANDELFERAAAALTSFVSCPAEDVPSPLAVLADQTATIFAARIMQQVRASAAGIASGQAQEAMAEASAELAGGSPMLGILAGLLPKKIRNQMLRNPQMVRQLALFGKNGGNHTDATPEGSGGASGSVLGRLRSQS